MLLLLHSIEKSGPTLASVLVVIMFALCLFGLLIGQILITVLRMRHHVQDSSFVNPDIRSLHSLVVSIIVSASRSPPGLCPKQRGSRRVPNEFTFRAPFKIIVCALGVILTFFSIPGTLWGVLWAHFLKRKSCEVLVEPQGTPKRRLPLFEVSPLDTY